MFDFLFRNFSFASCSAQTDTATGTLAARRKHVAGGLFGILKRLGLAALLAMPLTLANAEDVQWTDFVLPGTQQDGQVPYQSVFSGSPGSSGYPNGCTLRADGAWYRLCKCFGAGGCVITYESIGTLQCPPDNKLYKVVTARGRTKKECGKSAIERTVEIIKELGKGLPDEDKYTWDVNPGTRSTENDREVTKLDLDQNKRPDETTKAVEDKKTDEKPKTATGTGGGGTKSATTDKKPRKAVKRVKEKTRVVRRAPPSDGGAAARDADAAAAGAVLLGIGVGTAIGMGSRGGGMHDRDRGMRMDR